MDVRLISVGYMLLNLVSSCMLFINSEKLKIRIVRN